MIESAQDPTIYQVIRDQHRAIAEQLDALSREQDVARGQQLFAEVRDALERHARAEEAVFYDIFARGDAEGKALAKDAERDHSQVRQQLAELEAMRADDAEWGAKIEALTRSVTEHVEFEEDKLFAAVEELLDDDQARTLAETFEALQSRVEPEAAA
ncbi:Hemerythrin HHE cation binding domain-containing protein [Nannocystis exedens]|uniref:Hemerythrin HHE cation binding domain-containing protein n=1 Tax=Nannocystis exedens TaxID=54 RepID=A0A1I2IE86_9BACT|nr:hemerythrin domain-containing protein [Nannocystis exedens]PCC67148.1 hemerythrin [Nannocystis exedens]SFF39953.1 Hemerythrin HHE cation binding domain-containing protein [Nannocystis exedens]